MSAVRTSPKALRIACWYCTSAARSRASAASLRASRRPPAKIGCVTTAASCQMIDGAGEQVGERRALRAEEAGERDRREHLGARHADARVRRGEAALGFDQVGPAQQQLRGQAGRHRRRAGLLVEQLLELDARSRTPALGVRPSSTVQRDFLALALALERRQLRAHRRRSRPRAGAARTPRSRRRLQALALQAERLLAQAHGLAREVDLLVERAQREVGLRHLRGEREAHRFARGLARLELGARRRRVPRAAGRRGRARRRR